MEVFLDAVGGVIWHLCWREHDVQRGTVRLTACMARGVRMKADLCAETFERSSTLIHLRPTKKYAPRRFSSSGSCPDSRSPRRRTRQRSTRQWTTLLRLRDD